MRNPHRFVSNTHSFPKNTRFIGKNPISTENVEFPPQSPLGGILGLAVMMSR